jgi:hypothetical protein
VLIRNNHLLLLFWIFLFAFITGNIAVKYGIPYLFLDPEYLNKVGFWSYFITGSALGGFVMAFNIASYLRNSYHFPFIATLNRPFLKYSLNNFIVPLGFLIVYYYYIFLFQAKYEFKSFLEVMLESSGILCGLFLFLAVSYIYFFSTNKNVFQLFGISVNPEDGSLNSKTDQQQQDDPAEEPKGSPWKAIDTSKLKNREWLVETYLSHVHKIRLARDYEHYDEDIIKKVLNQNHFNAARYQVVLFVSMLALSWLRDFEMFNLPAGASILMLFTMFLMIISAIQSWTRGWSGLVLVMLLLGFNFLSKYEIFNSTDKAYGLDYTGKKALYQIDSLKAINENMIATNADLEKSIEILNKWKAKNQYSDKTNEKPLLFIVNTSGGGLRSALWTFKMLQVADSVTNGEFFRHTELITGASGGMIGASYFRELILQKEEGKIDNVYSSTYVNNISSDILNPVAFSLAIHDFFIGFQQVKIGEQIYPKDRAYAFEKQLNENTGNVMDKILKDYKEPEAEAKIPLMVISPTIVNDGRRLIISSTPVSYLTNPLPKQQISANINIEEIEFMRFLKEQGAENMKFTTALRMNATFPYITPNVSLPTEPLMQVMDAGLRDNYGLKTTIKFLYSFKDWIILNTGGVVILQIMDRNKKLNIENTPFPSTFEKLVTPLGSIYDNIFNIQDFTNDQLIQYASLWFNGKVQVISFELPSKVPNKISLSWHLTKREKQQIMKSVNLPNNQAALKELKKLLKQ